MSEKQWIGWQVVCDSCGEWMESSGGYSASVDPSADLRDGNEYWLQGFDGKDYCPSCTVYDPSLEDADREAYEAGEREYDWCGMRPKSFWNIDLQFAAMIERVADSCSTGWNARYYGATKANQLISRLDSRIGRVTSRLILKADRLIKEQEQ